MLLPAKVGIHRAKAPNLPSFRDRAVPPWVSAFAGKEYGPIQSDGRVRYWGRVTDPRDGRERVLRVVTLEDGATILNAFFDRGYREDPP